MYKVLKFSLLLTFIFLINSCAKEHPYGIGNGQITFWMSSEFGSGSISVYIDGNYEGTISHYHSNGVSCGSGDVNVTKLAGSHSFSAKAYNGQEWSSTETFYEDQCMTLELTGSGTTGGGGGGGSECSKYSLNGTWTRQNDGGCTNCSGMQISYSGGVGTIQYVNAANSAHFTVGQVKWKDYDETNCTQQELIMPSGDYGNSNVSFIDDNTLTSGGSTYTR